jgi:hypothetical protein
VDFQKGTVAELIEALSGYGDHLPVLIRLSNGKTAEPELIDTETIDGDLTVVIEVA